MQDDDERNVDVPLQAQKVHHVRLWPVVTVMAVALLEELSADRSTMKRTLFASVHSRGTVVFITITRFYYLGANRTNLNCSADWIFFL